MKYAEESYLKDGDDTAHLKDFKYFISTKKKLQNF